jgi:hypothetical protein
VGRRPPANREIIPKPVGTIAERARLVMPEEIAAVACPFSLITGIKVSCGKDSGGNTVLDVVVDTLRTVLWLGFAAALACVVWISAPPSVAFPFTVISIGLGLLQWAMSLSLVWGEIVREVRSETRPSH